MTFRLVRAEPSDSMIEAGNVAAATTRASGVIWRVMLAASEPLTDAEIDELCVALCRAEAPDGPLPWQWHKERDGAWIWRAESGEEARASERVTMRAFATALEGHPK